MPKVNVKIGPIIIGVRDIEIAKEFYINVFGIVVTSRSPNYLSANLGDIVIELEEDSPSRFPNWAKNNISTYKNSEFVVDNMKVFLENVLRFGGRIVSQPKNPPWGGQIAEIADIDGNIFLISQST